MFRVQVRIEVIREHEVDAPSTRSGFRRRTRTPAKHLNFDFVRLTPHFAPDDSV